MVKVRMKAVLCHLLVFLLAGMAVLFSAETKKTDYTVYAAQTPELKDGIYQIGTAEELLGFAELVNTGAQESDDAVLTENIDLSGCAWTPIGNPEKPYTGTFDGQDHTVSGYTCEVDCTDTVQTKVAAGFFGCVMDGGIIQNLTVEGTLSVTGGGYPESIGGIVGYGAGTDVTVQNVISRVDITVDASMTGVAYLGGIVGEIGGGSDTTAAISKCVNYGTIDLNSVSCKYVGGIAGFGNALTSLGIVNCGNYGDICDFTNTSRAAGILGYINDESSNKFQGVQYCLSVGKVAQPIMNAENTAFSKMKGNFYEAFSYTDSSCTKYGSSTVQEGLQSGRIAYYLNGSVDGGTNWYQNLSGESADEYPVLDNTHGQVYYDGESIWANEKLSKKIKTFRATVHALIDREAFPETLYIHTAHVECVDIVWKNADGTDINSETAEAGKTYAVEITMQTVPDAENTYVFSNSVNASFEDLTVENTEYNESRTQVVLTGTVEACAILKITAENANAFGLTEEEAEKYAGAYAIPSATELMEFARIVNINGALDISGVFMGDIDCTDISYTPIGTNACPFAGTMYGRNYRIKNLALSSQAVFGYITGGVVIENVILDSSSSVKGYSGAAGIVANDSTKKGGTRRIIGCGNEAAVSASYGSAAGIFASTASLLSIENCYNTGTITNTNGSAIAIAPASVVNCYNTGALAGKSNAFANKVTHCYQINDFDTQEEGLILVPAEDFTSGKIAYLLNGSVNGGETWRQNLLDEQAEADGDTADTHPVLDTSHKKVYFDGESTYANTLMIIKLISVSVSMDTLYKNGYFPGQAVSETAQAVCTGVTWQTSDKIANKQDVYDVTVTLQIADTEKSSYVFSKNIQPENVLLNEISAKSAEVLEDGTLQVIFAVPVQKLGFVSEDNYREYGLSDKEYRDYIGYRVIEDGEALLMFAENVNAGNRSSNALLTADIDLEGMEWTPIGKEISNGSYIGTFDGRGHRICNLKYNNAEERYVGLFGYVGSGAKILGVVLDKSCSFYAKSGLGGLIGSAWNATQPIVLKNCGNEASITGAQGNVGGLIGYIYRSTINLENCYNSGKISVESGSGAGALTIGSGTGKAVNCYNSGEVCVEIMNADSKGRHFIQTSFTTEGCYQLAGVDTSLREGITELTQAQYASGEAAYLLNGSVNGGSLWHQNLTAEDSARVDAFPVLDQSHGTVYTDGEGIFSNTKLVYKLSSVSITCDGLKKWNAFPSMVTVNTPGVYCESVEWLTEDTEVSRGQTYQAKIRLKAQESILFGKNITKDSVTVNAAGVKEVTVSEDGTDLTVIFEMTAMDIGQITGETYGKYGLSKEEYTDYQGYYGINDLESFLAFDELINAGNTSICGVLTADIDLTGNTGESIDPIWENYDDFFCDGVFDGRGHRIIYTETEEAEYDQRLFGIIASYADLYDVLLVYKLPSVSITCDGLQKWNAFPTKVTVNTPDVYCESVEWLTEDAEVARGQTYQAKIRLKVQESVLFGKKITKDTVTVNAADVKEVTVSEDGTDLTVILEMTAMDIGQITGENYERYGLSKEEYTDYPGYYGIDDAEALLEFAKLVNAGNTSICGVLTADIDLTGKTWVPIGTFSEDLEEFFYCGTFDGRGHRILHMKTEKTGYNQGLFGIIADHAALYHIIIDQSCEVSAVNNVAGLAGALYLGEGETVIIQGCGNEAAVSGNENAGGMVGVAVLENGELRIENCYNSGNVTANDSAGAIVAYQDAYTYGGCRIKDCLNTGVIMDAMTGKGDFNYVDAADDIDITNCYHIENTLHTGVPDGVETVTAEQLASGEIAYLLNHKVNGGSIWRQNLQSVDTVPADAYPVLDSSHDRVYTDGAGNFANERLDCQIKQVSMEMDLYGGCDFLKEAVMQTPGIRGEVQWNTEDAKVQAGKTYEAKITLKTETEGDFFSSEITPADVLLNGAEAESVTLNADGTLSVLCSITAWNISKLTEGNYTEYGFSAAEYASYAGWYVIDGEEELFAFAELANSKDSDANAVLSKDILISDREWTSIGSIRKPYTGQFDGRGHSITGVSVTVAYADEAGFFGGVKNTKIANLTIEGKVLLQAGSITAAGGIVAAACGNLELENLVNQVNITLDGGKVYAAGGILGRTTGSGYIRISNCVNSGALPENGCGILGYAYNDETDFGGIRNCLNTGTCTYGIARIEGSSKDTGSNNFYLSDTAAKGAGTGIKAEAVTAEQLAGGEITYRLNGSVSGGDIFRQNLTDPADACPVLDASHEKVYRNYQDCLGQEVVYSNRVISEAHSYDANDVCEKCGYCEADGKYYIGTKEILKVFAGRVNSGSADRDAVLTADISIEDTFGIGTSSVPYAGNFDGNGHTIHVAYESSDDGTALFPHLSGTVKNLTVAGSIVTDGKYAAGIAGVSHGAVISHCISEVDITSEYFGAGMHGGIVGLCQGGNTSTAIENCAFTGSITGNYTTSCAGIAGYSAGSTTIENSYVYADFALNRTDKSSKSICGGGAQVEVTNCYYLTGNPADDSGEEKTADEFASGAVAYLLNGAESNEVIWYQNLGETDELSKELYPTLVKDENCIVYYIEEYEKYTNLENWLDTLIVPVVKTMPKLSGVYGTAVENLTLTEGVMTESSAKNAKAVEGTWELIGENLSEVLEVGTEAEYTLKFIPDERYTYKMTEVSVVPEITPYTLTAENTAITLGRALVENGSEQTQEIAGVRVTFPDSSEYDLTENTDYTVKGNQASAAGIYSLTVTGCGNYQGEVTEEYTVAQKGETDNGSGDGGSTNGGSSNGGSDNGGSTNGGSSNGGSDNGGNTNGGDGAGIDNTDDPDNGAVGTVFSIKGINYTVTAKDQVTVSGLADKSLKTINIPAAVTYEKASYKVTAIAAKAFKGNKKCTKVLIGNNVKTIGASAFEKCTKLASVNIGKNVAAIGKKAFYGNKKLNSMTIKTIKLTNKNVGKQAFKGISKKAKIKVPKKKLKDYKTMLVKKGVDKKVRITK